jgi:catechol 2,3-dioxygenase-like lactoylglutathione lyase family enzyme
VSKIKQGGIYMFDVRHFGIVVSDIEKALWFYKDLIGLEVSKDLQESGTYIDNFSALKGVDVRTVKMTSPNGGMVELLYYSSHPEDPNSQPINAIGCSHVAFTVQDLDKVYKEFSEHGIHFNSPPQLSPDGYAKVTFCRDPDGSLVELVEVLK